MGVKLECGKQRMLIPLTQWADQAPGSCFNASGVMQGAIPSIEGNCLRCTLAVHGRSSIRGMRTNELACVPGHSPSRVEAMLVRL